MKVMAVITLMRWESPGEVARQEAPWYVLCSG
jgi:hypothetical protein